MFKFRLASAFVLLLLAGACGSPPTSKSAEVSAPSSSPTPAAALLTTPTPSAAPTASPAPMAWVTYKEPAWGYSINMPADWHLVSVGEPDAQQLKSFSNENVSSVTTLKGLDANGTVMNIIVSPLNSGCPGDQPPVGWAESTVPAVAINIDGYNSVVSGNLGQGTTIWSVQAISSSGKYCYSFVALTLSHKQQLKMTPLFEQMLKTFSFGTPIAPPF